jgi:hypothetical protein
MIQEKITTNKGSQRMTKEAYPACYPPPINFSPAEIIFLVFSGSRPNSCGGVEIHQPHMYASGISPKRRWE